MRETVRTVPGNRHDQVSGTNGDPIGLARKMTEGLIGSLLLEPRLIGRAAQHLLASIIDDPVCRRVFAVICSSMPPTLDVFLEQLEQSTGPKPREGWATYLSALQDAGGFMSADAMEAAAEKVAQANAEVRAIRATRRAADALTVPGAEVAEILKALEAALQSSRSLGVSESRPVPVDLERIATEGIPDVPWLIPGWLTGDDVAILAGGPYSGKSTLAYDLAQALACGRPWCGIEPSGEIRVLVLDEEQGERAAARLMIRLGGHTPNLRLFSGAGFNFGTPEGIARVEREIDDFRPGLVIGDSMTQLLTGIESENDSLQMGRFFREFFRLRDRFGCAFLLLDHRSKWGRGGAPAPSELLDLVLRGSTVKGIEASTVWYMARNDHTSADLRQAKRREVDRLLSLRIGYETEKESGLIKLSGLGSPAELLTETDKAKLWLLEYLSNRETARRAEIISAGSSAGHKQRSVERAMQELKRIQKIDSPVRGVWRKPLGGNLAESWRKLAERMPPRNR